MRKAFIIGALMLSAAAPAVTTALACGDKLMLLTRGARFGQVVKHAHAVSILAYISPNSAVPAVVRDLEMQLKDAGDTLQVVNDPTALDEALKIGKYDIVLADVADAEGLQQLVRTTPSRPMMLPVVYKPTRAEESAAGKKFSVVLKAPGNADRYLMAIDKAMEQKLKSTANDESR